MDSDTIMKKLQHHLINSEVKGSAFKFTIQNTHKKHTTFLFDLEYPFLYCEKICLKYRPLCGSSRAERDWGLG